MHNTSDKYLLQIHPESQSAIVPINDELTIKMEQLLSFGELGTQYRGWHNCTGCGKTSGSHDIIVSGYITNSLAAHYLKWHRGDVPDSEIEKIKQLD